MFTQKSRFSVLIEDALKEFKEEKETKRKNIENDKFDTFYKSEKNEKVFTTKSDNSFKGDMSKGYRNYNSEYIEYRNKQDELKRVEKEKKQKEEIRIALSIESYPELIHKKVTNNKIIPLWNDVTKHLNTVKNEIKELKDNLKKEEVEKINKELLDKNMIIENKQITLKIMDELVRLHEKRTNEYINLWGIEEWEKMFLFPNYDYNYFDDLDDEEEEIQNNLDCLVENDFGNWEQYDNYWKY